MSKKRFRPEEIIDELLELHFEDDQPEKETEDTGYQNQIPGDIKICKTCNASSDTSSDHGKNGCIFGDPLGIDHSRTLPPGSASR